MLEFIAKYRVHVAVLLMLLVPATTLAYTRGKPGRGPVDGVAISGLAWIQSGSFLGLSFLEELWQDYVALRDLKEENAQLRTEVARLREERARLLGVLQENARLRSMLEFKQDRPELDLRVARVIARDVTPYFRVVRVRLDATHPELEVQPQMAVVSHDGVVGQVIEVYDGFADVLLVSDPRSRVDVISQRNRTRGMLVGKGHKRDYEARLGYLQAKDDVKVGDVLVTSGKGGVFPKELLVGTISEVDDEKFQIHQEATVEPIVDVGRLEEVFIVTGADAAARRP